MRVSRRRTKYRWSTLFQGPVADFRSCGSARSALRSANHILEVWPPLSAELPVPGRLCGSRHAGRRDHHSARQSQTQVSQSDLHDQVCRQNYGIWTKNERISVAAFWAGLTVWNNIFFIERKTWFFLVSVRSLLVVSLKLWIKNLKVFKWGCSEAITRTTTRRYSMGYSMNAMQNTDSMVKW